jgi:hypothetical protein
MLSGRSEVMIRVVAGPDAMPSGREEVTIG